MNTQRIIFLIIGLALGFIVGFALANGINRDEHDKLQAELTRLRAGAANTNTNSSGASQSSPQSPDGNSVPTLTDEQLRNAIAKADASPTDASLQKISGQGLYVYAMQTGNASILPDAARILKRAQEANPKDYQLTVVTGNALFLVARNSGDTARIAEARKYYEQALQTKPDDVLVRTSLGMTYFYDKPSDPQRAIREYRKSLAVDPRHEPTLQNLVPALIATDNLAEAERRLDELERLNSANEDLPNLRAQLEQKKNAAREKD